MGRTRYIWGANYISYGANSLGGETTSFLPGQPEEEFTVRKYKEDLGKPYNRITLYLCPAEPVQLDSETEAESDTQGAR